MAEPPVLDHAHRSIRKATLSAIDTRVRNDGHALAKNGYVRQLGLQPGETQRVRSQLLAEGGARRDDAVELGRDDELWSVLEAFEGTPMVSMLPNRAAVAALPLDALRTFGVALEAMRRDALAEVQNASVRRAGDDPRGAASVETVAHAANLVNLVTVVNRGLDSTVGQIGMLSLERIEMAPAGIERGGLIATVPLAPLEETAIVTKEWSVTTKEFTSIVTDSLETISETGVTDNTELAQSTTSQATHSNQFNITGTVSGGIPIITGSTTTGFGLQDASSQSATESRKHAASLTQRASSRAKQEHKVTISTTTETGASETSTRLLRNPSSTDAMRIDYFSLMRKWRVRLYRYGLRLTYDLAIPEPAASLRQVYAELDLLRRRQQVSFEFDLRQADISTDLLGGVPKWVMLGEKYGVAVPPPPAAGDPMVIPISPSFDPPYNPQMVPLNIPATSRIVSITLSGYLASPEGYAYGFGVLGTTLFQEGSLGDKHWPPQVLQDVQGGNFLQGASGPQKVLIYIDDANKGVIQLKVDLEVIPEAMQAWRQEAWRVLRDAALAQHYDEQQAISARIAQLEDELSNVDTLTLRREESEEIMKNVLRFILGPDFEFMPDAVQKAFAVSVFKTKGSYLDLTFGAAFSSHELGLGYQDWSIVRQYEDVVRFINQAIEWENVVTFLYSYFWDVPLAWDNIRRIRHPDKDRQAFLRAGSARVVLTVRKGWEEAWVQFAEGGFKNAPVPASHPYLTIAKEIAAYDDHNYPGIPPANPAAGATRIQDSAYTTTTEAVTAQQSQVTMPVSSSEGFEIGGVAFIGQGTGNTESQRIVDIPDKRSITVEQLGFDHPANTPILLPGEKGALIAEWNEYTPTSGTDIAVTSNLTTIA